MDNLDSNTERRKGQHVTYEERVKIHVLHNQGWSNRAIARELGVTHTTVNNELKRNTPPAKPGPGRPSVYNPTRAQKMADARRSLRKDEYTKLEKCEAFIEWMSEKFTCYNWSFEACVGYARINGLFPGNEIPCVKTLYNWVWADVLPIQVMDLPMALKRKKTRKKKDHSHKIHLGKSIDERPEIVSERTEFGHWEIDTVVGPQGGTKPVVLTLLEKTTHYYMAIRIDSKHADAAMHGMDEVRSRFGEERFNELFKTITADNGTEFARLSELENLGVGVYFAHPYSSYERGQNERHNGLLRETYDKGTDFTFVTQEELDLAADRINSKPRKSLGFANADDLFEDQLDLLYAA